MASVEVINGAEILNAFPSNAAHTVSGLALVIGLVINSTILGSRYGQIGVLKRSRWQFGEAVWHTRVSLGCMWYSNVIYAFMAAILSFGVGLSRQRACDAAIWTCVFAYCLTKFFIYSFYLERSYIVLAPDRRPRWRIPLYCANFILFCGTAGALVTLCVKRTAFVEPDTMECRIGVTRISTIYIISWDILTSACLTLTFATQIWTKTIVRASRLRRIAIRSCIGAGASLCATTANMAALLVLHDELGMICLSACLLDVTVNAVVLALLTSARGAEDDQKTFSQTQGSFNETEIKRRSKLMGLDATATAQQQALAVDMLTTPHSTFTLTPDIARDPDEILPAPSDSPDSMEKGWDVDVPRLAFEERR